MYSKLTELVVEEHQIELNVASAYLQVSDESKESKDRRIKKRT